MAERQIKYILEADNKTTSAFSDAEKDAKKLNSTFDSGAKSQKSIGKEFQDNIKNTKILGVSIGSLTKSGFALTAGIGAMAAAYATLSIKMADVVDKMTKNAQMMEISIDDYQQLSYIASRSGTSIETVKTSFTKLTAAIDMVNKGNKETTKTFNDIGISVRDSNGNLKTSSVVFKELLLKLADMKDKGQRAAIAQDLLGRAYQEFIPLLNQGSDGIQKLMDKSQKFLGVNEEQAKQAEVLSDSFADLKLSISNALIAITSPSWNTLSKIFDKLADITNQFIPIFRYIFKFYKELFIKLDNLTGNFFSNTLDNANNFLSDIKNNVYNFISAVIYGFEKLKNSLNEIFYDLSNTFNSILMSPLIALARMIGNFDKEYKGVENRIKQLEQAIKFPGISEEAKKNNEEEIDKLKETLRLMKNIYETGKIDYRLTDKYQKNSIKHQERLNELLSRYNMALKSSEPKKLKVKKDKDDDGYNPPDNSDELLKLKIKNLNKEIKIITDKLSINLKLRSIYLDSVTNIYDKELLVIRENYQDDISELGNALKNKLISQEQYENAIEILGINRLNNEKKVNQEKIDDEKETNKKKLQIRIDIEKQFISISKQLNQDFISLNKSTLESLKGMYYEGMDPYKLLQYNTWVGALGDLSTNYLDTMTKMMEASSPEEKMKVMLTGIADAFKTTFQSISQYIALSSERRIEAMNKESQALSKWYDKEKATLESSRMSRVRRDRALGQLDQQRLAKEEEIQKKIEAERKSAAKRQLQLQLIQGIGSVALGVTNSLALGPFGIPTAAIIGAMGAIQIGLIASQLAQFAKGGIVEGSQSGDRNLIRANGGELILNKQQQTELYNIANGRGNSSRSIGDIILGDIIIEGNTDSNTVGQIQGLQERQVEDILYSLKKKGRLNYIYG